MTFEFVVTDAGGLWGLIRAQGIDVAIARDQAIAWLRDFELTPKGSLTEPFTLVQKLVLVRSNTEGEEGVGEEGST